MGRHLKHSTHRDVCADQTLHAEVVEVMYDASRVYCRDLLKVFWESHDPSQFNRQGPDLGNPYPTAILYYSLEQEAGALASKEELEQAIISRRM